MRTQSGTSLVSLLVATLIMGFVAIAMMGLMSLNTTESRNAYLRTDNLNAARVALDRMGRLIRMARCIGDVQGTMLPTTNPFTDIGNGPSTDTFLVKSSNFSSGAIEAGSACDLSTSFPSNGDPYYGPTGTERSRISSWPFGGAPYTLDGETLVIQVPTFDANGFPQNHTNGQNLSALDTYVYQIVDDPSRGAGYYRLQVACFPAPVGKSNAPTSLAPGTPQTVLSGIVGPIDPATNRPGVFRYISSRDNTITANPIQSDLVLYSGIQCNLQIMQPPGGGNQRGIVLPIKSTMYLRNNTSCSIMGPSPPPPQTE